MALTTCPDCKKQISDSAITCIHCGSPLRKSREAILAEIKLEEDNRKYWSNQIDRIIRSKTSGQYDSEILNRSNEQMAIGWEKLLKLYESLRELK